MVTGQSRAAKEGGYGHNIAAAIVEGATVVSAGLQCAGNVGGAPLGWGPDIASTLLFFTLSQVGFSTYTVRFLDLHSKD